MSIDAGRISAGGGGRRIARTLLVLVTLASWLPSSPLIRPRTESPPEASADTSLVVTLYETDTYGTAALHVAGRRMESLDELVQRCRQSFPESSAAEPVVWIRASGGVRQGELERVRAAMAQAFGRRPIRVALLLLDDSVDDLPRERPATGDASTQPGD